jgi:hypothetical protein
MTEQSAPVGKMPADFKIPSKSRCVKILRKVFDDTVRFKRIDDLTIALVERTGGGEREILRASAKVAAGLPGLPWIVVLAGCRSLGYETEVTKDKDGHWTLQVKEIETAPAEPEPVAPACGKCGEIGHTFTECPQLSLQLAEVGITPNAEPFDSKGTPHMPAIGGGCHELCGAERPHLGEPVS